MPFSERSHERGVTVQLNGKFTFADSGEFRKLLQKTVDSKAPALEIRLENLTFMDSSGLGMLMVALRECQTHKIALSLHQPKGDVKELLQMTKSYERFTVVD